MAGAERHATIGRAGLAAGTVCVLAWFLTGAWPGRAAAQVSETASHQDLPFQTSHDCLACHNGLTTPSGEDVSIGVAWRASMMANSARDPYWQASVRREIIDHPGAREAIEDECSICHMPMSTTIARAAGESGAIFAHLPIGSGETERARLAADGVSCTLCHQIGTERLGTRESFTGGYAVSVGPRDDGRPMFGPFQIDEGRAALMRSATGVSPTEGLHIRQSEVCATCHTLFTRALDPQGRVTGELPEQVPYLEWRHSAFRGERSCQSCHMPAVAELTLIASVVGEPRENLGQHTFLGGNFFMLRMLNRYRDALSVDALPTELDRAAQATVRQLQTSTASVLVAYVAREADRIVFDVSVSNLTGHKLPTGYPSRRAWLHVTVRDRAGRVVFESGAVKADGSVEGNDQDADPARYEPHYETIRSADQVQIYESVMTDAGGAVTTGLLFGTAFIKDNRLLPRGFDKTTASRDIAVQGAAAADPDFGAGGDRVRYSAGVGGAEGPFTVEAELRYQPISYRWAQNLRRYEATETDRFVTYYDSMAAASSVMVARHSAAAE
jgi:hypothetical protein